MTEAADRKENKDSADDESLNLASTELAVTSRKEPTVTDTEWLKNS